MLSTRRTDHKDLYQSLPAGNLNGLKRNAKRKRTKVTDTGPRPPLSRTGRS